MREMKDSGIEWIGDIPKVWKLKRLKALLVERKEKNDPVQTHFILSLGANYGVIPYSQKEGGGNKAKEDVSSYRLAYPGDIVMNSMNIISGSVGLSNYFGCVSPVYYMFYPRNRNSKTEYYHYLFQTKVFQHSLLGLGNGILMKESGNGTFNTVRMRIPVEKLNALMLPFPPLNEQERIVVFLDSECAAIDTILEKTRASIDEYKKLKQAIITQAVTKGIRGNRPMKDSGIEWIGKIESQFEIYKLKYLLKNRLSYGANESGVPFDESLPRYIRITDIAINGGLKDKDKLSLANAAAADYLLSDGDILFARSGATVGKAFIYKKEYGKASFAGYLIKASVNDQVVPQYIFYYTQSSIYEEWKKQIFIQSTIQNIGADRYANLPIILPNLDIQKQIVSFLDTKCTEIDNLISKKEQYITEIENYKKSLIYEYVTGKKEVI